MQRDALVRTLGSAGALGSPCRMWRKLLRRSPMAPPLVRSPLCVSAETAGLGNRLKSWVSAMRLGADTRVCWEITPNMPARFDDLFANDCAVETVPPGTAVYASWRLAILPEDETHLPYGFATAGGGRHPLVRGAGKAWWTLTGKRSDRYRYMLFPKSHSRRITRRDARHIDLEYERIPQYFRDVYVPLFARIKPLPVIERRVAAWNATNEIEKGATVGVQVRTWRDSAHRHRKYHRPALDRLLRLLDRTESSSRFFVVSDSDEIAPQIAARYGAERVLQYPRRTARAASWESAEGIVEDLIDLLLLSRTPRLCASYLSTFSEAAWWLGGARARVDVF